MSHRVITISREYAAYGRTVAAALSKELGIEYYDKDFVKKTAEESGFDVELVEKEGESLSHAAKNWDSFLGALHTGYSPARDDIFNAQCKAIIELSMKPCIIVGRCANVVLREAGIPSFDIYLYASAKDRAARARELVNDDSVDILKYIAKQDEARHTYYKTYTGKEMGDTSIYDICLNVGTIGLEKTEEILLSILK